ncbi:MAG: hypothetical protein HRT44_00125 [Bdellovibrionales bacterium]|nr:hypothetical protein [Bdellovibrionales bacterium]NQZ17662.1 hypothetical protein [Bdellovibrionales bacterium]
MATLILNIHFATCLFMTGVIWIVQLVHYPSFAYVASESFYNFNKFHQMSISLVVMPAMILELLTGFALVALSPANAINVILLGLLLLIWLSTFFLSVPLHNSLMNQGFDTKVIEQLVFTNWPRTILWSLRSTLLIYIMAMTSLKVG